MIYLAISSNAGGRTGHRLKDLMTGWIISELYNYQWVWIPPIMCQKQISSFGLDQGLIQVKELPNIKKLTICQTTYRGLGSTGLKKVHQKIIDFQNKHLGQDILVILEKCTRVHLHQIERSHPSIYHKIQKEFNLRYHQRNNHLIIFKTDHTSVAVHIRRGDIAAREKKGILNIKYYQHIINLLSQHLSQPDIIIFSEELNHEDIIQTFQNHPQVRFQFGGSFSSAFHHFVKSDIFVLGNSGMSTWAAYLNSGIKIYHPSIKDIGNPLDSNYLQADKKGNFNIQMLNKKFNELNSLV